MVEMQCRMWCGLECVLWDSAVQLYLNVVICMTWCKVECGRDVEWCADVVEQFDVNHGAI